MALDLQRSARRRMRLVLLVVAGVAVLTGGIVVGLVVGSGDSPTGSSPDASPDTNEEGGPPGPDDEPAPGPTRTVEPPVDYTAPDQWVRLPAPTSETEGLPTGWPQTPEGAVAMVASSSRNAWTWDEEQVAAGIRAYVNEHDRDDVLARSAGSAAGIRALVGLPESGPVPDDAAVSATVIGVQWEQLADDQVRVNALMRVVFTPGDGADVRTQVYSTTNDAVWEHGDWKIQPVPAEIAQNAPEVAELGSQEFIDAGWVAIQEGDVR